METTEMPRATDLLNELIPSSGALVVDVAQSWEQRTGRQVDELLSATGPAA
jgi:hypothetical protein